LTDLEAAPGHQQLTSAFVFPVATSKSRKNKSLRVIKSTKKSTRVAKKMSDARAV